MVGDWEGSGWAMNNQARVKEEFTQTEEIRFDLDSTIIKVRGIGKSDGSIIHDAIAFISPNPKGGFFMTSFLGDGRGGKYELTGSNGNYVWKIPTPQGTVIYTITITESTWKEVGDFEINGQLYPFFEMNLKRIKS